MPGYSFAFGPDGSFFLNTPLGATFAGLLSDLNSAVNNDPQASDRFISIGAGGKYYYYRVNGRNFVWNGHVCDDVREWFNSRVTTGDSQFKFSFGPGNSWVACTGEGASWCGGGNSSDSLMSTMRDFHPIQATLGVDEAYVLVSGDGGVKWNLKGKYNTLREILSNTNLPIEAVALNPYQEGEFFIVWKYGQFRAFLPASNHEAVNKLMERTAVFESKLAKMQSDMMLQQAKTIAAEIASRNLGGNAFS